MAGALIPINSRIRFIGDGPFWAHGDLGTLVGIDGAPEWIARVARDGSVVAPFRVPMHRIELYIPDTTDQDALTAWLDS